MHGSSADGQLYVRFSAIRSFGITTQNVEILLKMEIKAEPKALRKIWNLWQQQIPINFEQKQQKIVKVNGTNKKEPEEGQQVIRRTDIL